ncbi:hypothetical protein HDU98_011056 [Podochytrium sp. JEL0797]|nr:hypothetical protein HDU98_011056 [Podochytrium sp. JEL0797]
MTMEAMWGTESSFRLDAIPSLAGKVAVVTGGNAGIGFETCRHLAKNGATVFMASRSEERASHAINKIKQEFPSATLSFLLLDLQDLSQVREAATALLSKTKTIDILVNNAGITTVGQPFALSKDGYELTFATNHLGHFLFTTLILPAVLASKNHPRIVNVSSWSIHDAPKEGIDFESLTADKGIASMILYGQSKLANVLFSTELNRRYGDKLIVNSLHPGVVSTEIFAKMPAYSFIWFASFLVVPILRLLALSPEKGAMASLYAATSPEIEEKKIKAEFIVPLGVVSTKHTQQLGSDAELAKKLWEWSEKAVASK